MASTVLAKMSVQIAANTAQFGKSLNSVSNQLSGFSNGLKGLAGTIGLAFGIKEVASFAFEVSRLAGEADGVKAAFDRLQGSQQVLEDLKKSTGGTVSELQLMKAAVQANNFQIPIQNLAELFKFATLRAQQTGQSVDYLVESIILGIGRKSPLILDNLGISAIRLREKLKGVSTEAATVGDVAKVVGYIAKEELGNMADFSENASTKVQRLSASWENFKVAAGKAANNSGLLNAALDKGTQLLNYLSDDVGRFSDKIASELAKGKDETNAFVEYFTDKLIELRKQTGAPLKFEADLLIEQYKLTGEQADILRGQLAFVNDQLSVQENTIKLLNLFKLQNGYDDLADKLKDVKDETERSNQARKIEIDAINAYKNQLYNVILRKQLEREKIKDASEEIQKSSENYTENIKIIRQMIKVLSDLEKQFGNTTEKTKDQVTTYDSLQEKLTQLNDQFESLDINDRKRLANIGNEIVQTKALIDQLDKLRQKREERNKYNDVELRIKNSVGLRPDYTQQQINDPNFKSQSSQFAQGPKTGSDFINDLGVNTGKQVEEATKNLKKLETVTNEVTTSIQISWESLSGMIAGAISDIAYSFGQAIAGVGNFGKSFLSALINFAKQFGEVLIGLSIAAIAAQKLATNPYTGLAAGVALVALAGAASAALQRSQSSYNSGSNSSQANSSQQGIDSGRLATNGQTVQVVGEVLLRGRDAYIMLKNYENSNGYTSASNG